MKTTHNWVKFLVSALCLFIAPTPAFSLVSDDFSSLELNPAAWNWIDPSGDVDHAAINGWLTISLPADNGHDLRQGVNRSARLMQFTGNDDFEIEARFESVPSLDFQAQGLLVEFDATHFLHLDIRRSGPDLKVSCASVDGGVTKVRGEFNVATEGSLSLRLVREGNSWWAFYSTDGTTWAEAFVFDHVMTVGAVGVFGANAGTGNEDSDLDRDDPVDDKSMGAVSVPGFEVAVDYFFNSADPIDPEDGDIRNGVRVAADLLALYYFTAGSGDVVFDYSTVMPKLDLTVTDTTTVVWLPEGGLDLLSPSLVATPGPAEKIFANASASGEITLEAWVDPVTTEQSGPARMVTVSADPSNRNVTLSHGQWGSLPTTVFDARLRTTETSFNGQPETISPTGSLTGALQHVVYTRDATGIARIFVDGVETVEETIGGTFDNWDNSYRLGIGAEMDGTRPWLGSIHLAAVYNRALSPRDVEINFGAGPDGGALTESPPVVTLHGLSPGEEFSFAGAVELTAVAGDADGTVDLVEFFAGDVLLAADTEAPFAFTWSMPAVGSHLISAVATDDEGLQTSSAIIPIQVSVPESFRSALFMSDDFHDETLGDPWVLADGTPGAVITQSDGHLVVDLPGAAQDPWSMGSEVVFAHQQENDGDIALELKLAAADFTGEAFGGLRLEGAGGEILQLLGEHEAGSWTLGWGVSDGTTFNGLGSIPVTNVTEGLWLQVVREAGSWTCSYSTDGYSWIVASQPVQAMVLSQCGWVAGSISTADTSTVAFDYAFNMASPIHPEDGGSGNDYIGPVISDFVVTTGLDQAALTWTTDEPAFYRVTYGLTTGYELGILQGPAFQTGHEVVVGGLSAGSHYHFKVTCVDTAGNFSTTGDMMVHTDFEPMLSDGPGAGDVYRETRKSIYEGNDWRVTDPDALNIGAAAFLPNPVLNIEVPDLTGAVRAELIIDRWGGHPGTSNKMVRLAGRSWLHLPELATIPDDEPECFMYEDNLSLDIPLDQLQSGSVTLEGTADEQICNSFDWGQWGWYGVVLRVYYDGSAAHPSGNIMSPAAGDTIIDAVDITVNATATGTVEEVQVLAYYEGFDRDGDGVLQEWQREYYRPKYASTVSIDGIVGKMTVAPYDVNWDAKWIPDQEPGTVKLQARILDDTGTWYVTEFVEDLSLRHSDGVVKMYSLDYLPPSFWVRDGRVKTAEFTIPAGDDLAYASGVRLKVPTWNGEDSGRLDVNGLWSATGFGEDHHYAVSNFSLSGPDLLQGVNEFTISATTEDHGMEVLWPGPMFFVRYGPDPAPVAATLPGDVDGDGVVGQADALLVLGHSVEDVRLSPAQIAIGDVSGDGKLDPWDAALISGAVAEKSDPQFRQIVWGEAEGRYGNLTLPLKSSGGSAHSLWIEMTAADLEDRIKNVTTDLGESGLFQWKVSGDKLRVAYAGSSPTVLPERLLEVVLDVADGKQGGVMRTIMAIDGSEPLDLAAADLADVPVRFALGDNYPNPFNPTTRVSFDLPVSGRVLLRIYDVRGSEIRTLMSGVMAFGTHTATWNGTDDRGRSVPSGVYFYRIEAEGFSATRKMMLLK